MFERGQTLRKATLGRLNSLEMIKSKNLKRLPSNNPKASLDKSPSDFELFDVFIELQKAQNCGSLSDYTLYKL